MKTAVILVLFTLGASVAAEAQTRSPRTGLAAAAHIETSATMGLDPDSHVAERRLTLTFRDVPVADVLAEIAAAAGFHLIYSPDLFPADRRVSLTLEDVPVFEAIRRVLDGREVRILSSRNTVVLARVEPGEPPEPRAAARDRVGEISGRVTDAVTGAALSAVSIVIEGTDRGALTDAAGRYRITGVPAGRQQVSAVSIGYVRATQEVEVQDGGVATVDFALEIAAVPLDRIVATGNVAEARIREMAAPISVIDAREIGRKQVQRIDQLFRGGVAGALAWDLGPHNYYSEIAVRGKSSLGAQYVKTYVDGVEASSHTHIATIDPNMIERVELVRGPQASTLYGSDAAGGVLQIFTKKGVPGVARPQITAKISAGFVETDYMDGAAITQEHSIGVSGGGQDFSYNFGGTFLGTGEYVPEADTRNTSVFGAARASQGGLTAELSARYYRKRFGQPGSPILRDKGYAPWLVPQNRTNDLSQSTIGLNVGYRAQPNWQHNLTVGLDRGLDEFYTNEPRLATPADTFISVSSSQVRRSSIRYHTSLDIGMRESLAATVTAGFDHAMYHATGFLVTDATTPTGTIEAQDITVTRLDYANTGYFAQARVGFQDALFLTAGVRADDSENFGDDYGLAVSPRMGLAYSRPLRDGLDAKFRMSWGRAIRAPQPLHKQEMIIPAGHFLANPQIGPEEQEGWDAGIDMVFGRRASLSVTYYDQMALGLIDAVLLDAGVVPPIFQFQNVGEMANKGWEVEGTLDFTPFRLSGTYSRVNSTVEKLSPTYMGDLQVGDRNLKVPEQSAGLALTYDLLRGSATLDVTYIGSFVNTDWIALYGFYYGGDEFRGSGREYWKEYSGLTRLALRMEQAITNDINAFLRIENLTNEQLGEVDNTQITAGRTTVLGVRITR